MSWVVRQARSQAAMRLFCFPHAGGGASLFRGWAARLPASIEVCAIQAPGREGRLAEPALTSLPALIDALVDETRRWRDRPFACFGHSVGALVAFELTRALRRRGEALPHHLFVSGCAAPHRRDALDEPSLSWLPDPQLRERLRRFGGTPDAVLAHEEMMDLLLPTLRADLGLRDGYRCAAESPLEVAITALGGRDDSEVRRDDVAAWRRHTAGRFAAHELPGGHFFLRSAEDAVVDVVAAALAPLTEVRRAG